MLRPRELTTREAGCAQAPLAASSNTGNGICRCSTDAINFWREQVANLNPTVERFWALTLDAKRRFTGVDPVDSRSLGDSQKFADELFAAEVLRGAPEFVLIHHRPGAVPEAGPADVQRVRAVILTGRSRKTDLLDCILVGEPNEERPSGVFSFHRIRGFAAQFPFSRSRLNPQPSTLNR